MARTLEQLDADLAAAEQRITQLINAGQAFNQRLNAAEDRLDTVIERARELKDQLDPILDLDLRKVREQFQKLRREFNLSRAPRQIEDRTHTVRVGDRTVRRALRD